jgi:hypothetical protein
VTVHVRFVLTKQNSATTPYYMLSLYIHDGDVHNNEPWNPLLAIHALTNTHTSNSLLLTPYANIHIQSFHAAVS